MALDSHLEICFICHEKATNLFLLHTKKHDFLNYVIKVRSFEQVNITK